MSGGHGQLDWKGALSRGLALIALLAAIAVLRGLFRPIRTFVRTPKQGNASIRLRTPMPVTEQVMTVFSLACVVYLGYTSPWVTASYALFCCAGFCTLTGYWWLVERK